MSTALSLTSLPPLPRDDATRLLWYRGNLSRKLWPQQRVIYDTVRKLPRHVQTVVLLCARQFGKSVLGTIFATEDCLQNDRIVNLIIGPTIKQTRAIVRPRMALITQDAPRGLIRHVKTEDTWYFANGSELKLGGFETKSTGQRGKTLYRIYLEETCDSEADDYDNFLRSDLGPALTHSKHAQIIHLTTLPRVPDHPFTLETVPEARMNGAYFEYTIHDNARLTGDQYDQCVKLCGGEHTTEFKREYLCQQVRDSSIILAPEFDEHLHIKPLAKPTYCNMWIGGDTGGIQDRTVAHLCAYDFDRAKVLFLDERAYPPETSTTTIVAGFKDMEAGHKIRSRHVDAPGQLQIDLMSQHKYPVALPRKDELEATVNQVRTALQTGKVEIDPKCKLLITTLRSGTFNKQRTDLARTQTLGHMDAFMSMAYALRHAIKANPYPIPGEDTHLGSHFVPTDFRHRGNNQSAQTLRSLFKV